MPDYYIAADGGGSKLQAILYDDQLRILKSAKLVRWRKSGKTVFYALADDHVRTIINQGIEHITEPD